MNLPNVLLNYHLKVIDGVIGQVPGQTLSSLALPGKKVDSDRNTEDETASVVSGMLLSTP